MNLWEILKTSKGFPPPDLETLLFARKISGQAVGGSTLKTLTASGYPCVLEGSVGMPVLDYKIYGNSVQDGTPTPENPIEVQSVGDKTKNLLKLIDRTNLDLRGTTVNIKDGTITITGTATSSGGRLVFLSDRFILSKGTYSLSMPNNAGVLSYLTRASDGVALSGRIIIDEDTEVAFGINVIHGTEYNVTLMPQLELGSEATPYEPYGYKIPVVVSAENHEPTTTNIYLNEPLRKIGDYADVIDFNRGVVERNTIEYAFTGAEAFWYTSSDENRAVAAFTFPNIRDKNVYFLNMFTIPPYSEMEYNRVVFDSNRICYVSLSYELIGGSYSDSNVTKLDNIRNWLKEQYESGNPLTMTIAYTSTTEPISLPSIPTFNGTTVISTDTQIQPSNIEIKYKARK